MKNIFTFARRYSDYRQVQREILLGARSDPSQEIRNGCTIAMYEDVRRRGFSGSEGAAWWGYGAMAMSSLRSAKQRDDGIFYRPAETKSATRMLAMSQAHLGNATIERIILFLTGCWCPDRGQTQQETWPGSMERAVIFLNNKEKWNFPC
jgi:hypothetical protein